MQCLAWDETQIIHTFSVALHETNDTLGHVSCHLQAYPESLNPDKTSTPDFHLLQRLPTLTY